MSDFCFALFTAPQAPLICNGHRSFGIKDTIRSHAVAGFSIPVRSLFDATANVLALRTRLTSPLRV